MRYAPSARKAPSVGISRRQPTPAKDSASDFHSSIVDSTTCFADDSLRSRAGRPIEAARCLLAKAHGERSMLQRSAALRSVVLGLELAGADDVPDELVVELLELKLELLIEGGQSSEAAEVVRDARQLVRRGTVAYLRLERLSAKMAEVACRWEDASEGFRHCLSEITYLGGPSASIEIASEWCNVQIDLVWLRYRSPIANSPPQVDVDSALKRVAELGTAQQRADVAQAAAAALENQRCRFVSSERALHLAHRALLASNELNDLS